MGGVRCQVSGFRCQVSGVRCQVSCVRCHVSGVRCQVSGVRCQVSGAQEASKGQILSYGAPMNSPDPEDFKLVSHLMHF